MHESGTVTKVHKESIDTTFLQFSVNYAGSVSIKDGKICWSPIDSIYCGAWDGNKVTSIRNVLPKGSANQICEGESFSLCEIIDLNVLLTIAEYSCICPM